MSMSMIRIGLVCCCLTRSEEHTSELQSPNNLVCRLLLEKKTELLLLRYQIAFIKNDQAGMGRESTLAIGSPGAEDWSSHSEFFFLTIRGPPRSTLFPYPTPFR